MRIPNKLDAHRYMHKYSATMKSGYIKNDIGEIICEIPHNDKAETVQDKSIRQVDTHLLGASRHIQSELLNHLHCVELREETERPFEENELLYIIYQENKRIYLRKRNHNRAYLPNYRKDWMRYAWHCHCYSIEIKDGEN